MVSRVTPANTTCPAAPAPAQPTPDGGVTAQNQLLARQNDLLGQMIALLSQQQAQLVQKAAAPATPDAAADATPAAPADATPDAAPDAPVTDVNYFEQESLSHVTGERIQAILDEALRTAEAKASVGWGAPADAATWDKMDDDRKASLVIQEAARTFSLEMAELIHSIPENQTWCTQEKHTSVLVHTKDYGWAPRWYEVVVDHITRTIIHQLVTKLITKLPTISGKAKYEVILRCIKDDALESVQSAITWYVTSQSQTAAGVAGIAPPTLAVNEYGEAWYVTNSDDATPPQAVDIRPVVINEFGEETFTHITGEHIQAIFDNALRTAIAVAPSGWEHQEAANIIALEVTKLIYSIPENQTWYILDDNRTVATHSGVAWALSWYEAVVQQIVRTVCHVLKTKLPREDKATYARLRVRMRATMPFHYLYAYVLNGAHQPASTS